VNPPPPPTPHTVIFNANGGLGTMANEVNTTAAALTANVFTLSGSTFSGWNTLANGTGTAYANNASYPFSADATFYAQWTVNPPPPPPTTFTLTYVAGANGSITGIVPQTVTAGGSGTSVTAVPAGGYHFVSWSDGNTGATRMDTNVLSSQSFTASFALTIVPPPPPPSPPTTYSLVYSAGTHGAITGVSSQTITAGGSGTPVTAVPSTGYHFVSWSDGNLSASRSESSVSASLSVSATFAPNGVRPPTNSTTFTLNYVSNGNGTISGVKTQTLTPGSNGDPVTATPAIGYHFVSWSDGATTATRTDTNVVADRSYSANFGKDLVVPLTHTIIVSSGPNGSVVPVGARVVNDGDTLQVTMTADSNYHVATLVVDGVTLAAADSFTFSNIQSDHTIRATFAVNTNGTSGPGAGQGPIIPEGSDGVKATESGTNDPVVLSLLQGGTGIKISAKNWFIEIASDKKSVYGIQLPTKIQVYLIRGVNATTSGVGFMPGTIAKVYLYSTRVYLGEATVQADGSFAAHFPVTATTTLGHHVMQVEGTAYDGKFRTAAVGLQVIERPSTGLVPLANIYYDLNISDLSAANRAKLTAVARTDIANNYREIWIYGYTDIQTGVNNIVLSKFRALKVIAYLHKLLPKLIITYKFFGPANPHNKAHTQAAFAENRRSEILGKP